MSTTENKTNDQIIAIGASNKLQAVADMAKADAINSFNLALRRSIEEYVTHEDRPLTIRRLPEVPIDKEEYWKRIVEDYRNTRFGSGNAGNFANKVASSITGYLGTTSGYGNYSIRYIYEGTDLRKIIEESVEETDDFFQLVDCPNYKECETGTFYITLDLTKIDDKEYEKIPKIEITDLATGEKITTPVLDKKKYRFYIPLRLFKVLAEGYKIAFGENDDGILSKEFHNELEDLEAGICIKNDCRAYFGQYAQRFNFCYKDKFANGQPNASQDVRKRAKEKIEEKIKNYKIEGFRKEKTIVELITEDKISAVIMQTTDPPWYIEENPANQQIDKTLGHLKIIEEDGVEKKERFYPYQYSTEEIEDYLINTLQIGDNKINNYSTCSQLSKMEVKIKLKEENIKYTVSGKPINYYLEIVDYYYPFTNKYKFEDGKIEEVDIKDAVWMCKTITESIQGNTGHTGCGLVKKIEEE